MYHWYHIRHNIFKERDRRMRECQSVISPCRICANFHLISMFIYLVFSSEVLGPGTAHFPAEQEAKNKKAFLILITKWN